MSEPTRRKRVKPRPRFEVVEPVDTGFEKAVETRLYDARVREEVRRRLDTEAAHKSFRPPAPGTLADALARPRIGPKYAIQELHPSDSNSLLVAQYKTGKTTLTLNLVRALADGLPFLGHFEVTPLSGRVAFFNYELGENMFLD